MTRRIVCVGNLVHDEVFQVESLPAVRHQDRRAATISSAMAGRPRRRRSRSAVSAASPSYWGRVGADAAGETAIRLMREHGVDCSGVAVLPEGRTLRAIVLVDGRGERSIVSDRRSLPTDPSVAARRTTCDDAGVVLVDSRWPAGAEIALDRARAGGHSDRARCRWRTCRRTTNA